ncbi:DUF1275 domain-containing protein [Lactococcus lactis]|uniref:YoaK family protein n=1 Tax=Lactococcus lactis TaxID=1358 RepID=UPI00223B834F|nr:YoaK family protein [Lactococcus lactis]MCT1227651.1 DUF1275 domain-containing protein [Lactococcus lactis]
MIKQKSDFLISNNDRFFAIFMAFSGGACDVYCHVHFNGLVATQTGNIVLIASDLSQKNWTGMLPKMVSIIAFTIGFLLGIWIKEKTSIRNWQLYTLIPVIFVTSLIPMFSSQFQLLKIYFLALVTGLIMLSFTGSKIEGNPYTIMMTSGNYRKMLSEWYIYLTPYGKSKDLKRNAQNYSLVVASFILGALTVAFINHIFLNYSIWITTITFSFSFVLKFYQIKKYQKTL